MEPNKLYGSKEATKGAPNADDLLMKLQAYKDESDLNMSKHLERWAKNTKIYKGIALYDKTATSYVRQRPKLAIRKVWGNVWRLVAAFYQAFLKDTEMFKYVGRDGSLEDTIKAGLVQYIVEYRRDKMFRRQGLFIKFIWVFIDILTLGIGGGKLCWVYNKELEVDTPKFVPYPADQLILDLSHPIPDEMEYVGFENYMTEEDLEVVGYELPDDAQPEDPTENSFRSARYMNSTDPTKSFKSANEYPDPSKTPEQQRMASGVKRYKVTEFYFRYGGRLWHTVVVGKVYQYIKNRKPTRSPYGDKYPLVLGQCLLEPHQAIGEGFPEPGEGPQESLNMTVNQRKDAVALTLNGRVIVDRYGGADLEALTTGKHVIQTDNMDGVRPMGFNDPTQTSYMEANFDAGVMDELMGVTATKRGESLADKSGVAQINLMESNAKIDLFIAIVAETFFREFFYLMGTYTQRFETDEKLIKAANVSLRQKLSKPDLDNFYDLDFDMDCEVNVGAGTVGRQIQIQEAFLATDKAIMANQSSVAAAQAGVVPSEGLKFIDVPRFILEAIMPLLGHKNIDNYIIGMQPPQAPGNPSGGPASQTMQGTVTPQQGAPNAGA